jgi:hypothetical protein
MLLVGEDGHLFDLTIFHVYAGKDIAMTKVSCAHAV